MQEIKVHAPFMQWFTADGYFVAKPFQQWLASSVALIGEADPKNAAGEPATGKTGTQGEEQGLETALANEMAMSSSGKKETASKRRKG